MLRTIPLQAVGARKESLVRVVPERSDHSRTSPHPRSPLFQYLSESPASAYISEILLSDLHRRTIFPSWLREGGLKSLVSAFGYAPDSALLTPKCFEDLLNDSASRRHPKQDHSRLNHQLLPPDTPLHHWPFSPSAGWTVFSFTKVSLTGHTDASAMKFGKNLPRNQVPEYANFYINYRGLKKIIGTEAAKAGEADLAGA